MIIERKIITGLIVSTDYLHRVAPFWDDDLLESPEMPRIAEWCLEFWRKYKRAPDRDIEQIFLSAVRDESIPKADAELIEKILTLVSDEYGRGEQFNSAYLYDQTVKHFRERRIQEHIYQLQDMHERGQIEEAEALATGYQPITHDDDSSLAAVAPRPISWVWRNRIALGKLTLFAGDSDEGKSTVLLDIAAKITSEGQWPDGSRARKGAVLIASTEDDYEDTVVPRLMAAGADLNLCYLIGLNAPDVKTLCREIELKITALQARHKRIKVVMIDPLSAFLGKVDGHNEGAVRVMMRPLLALAMKHRFAVISLHHTRKSGSGGSAKDQVANSKAFVSVARSAFLVVRDKDDDTKRLCLFLKGNLIPDAEKTGLAYRIVGADVTIRTPHGTETASVARIVWLDEVVTTSADEAIEVVRDRQPKLSEVKDWLTGILRDGPLPFGRILERARNSGYSEKTLRRAADEVGIQKIKDGYQGRWTWSMPARH